MWRKPPYPTYKFQTVATAVGLIRRDSVASGIDCRMWRKTPYPAYKFQTVATAVGLIRRDSVASGVNCRMRRKPYPAYTQTDKPGEI
ncbi:hypothetical protein [Escherichia sp. E4208]|uniref:hypothetical protein n=1 Tax=Escherichia sp. E4208 TaxID=2044463 RepID=UPI00107F6C0B|nr:hypothetical protein [Escherichia sp. E4208]